VGLLKQILLFLKDDIVIVNCNITIYYIIVEVLLLLYLASAKWVVYVPRVQL
jgi:hypothetical protein